MKLILNWFRLRKLEGDLNRDCSTTSTAAWRPDAFGFARAQARRRGPAQLGGTTHRVREEVRDVWLSRWQRDFAYDLRFFGSLYCPEPLVTAAGMLSLALGLERPLPSIRLSISSFCKRFRSTVPSALFSSMERAIKLAETWGTENLMPTDLPRLSSSRSDSSRAYFLPRRRRP